MKIPFRVGLTFLLGALAAMHPLCAKEGRAFEVAPETRERAKAATVLVDLGQSGSGSAFLIHDSGLFVTNRHVIESLPPGEPARLVVRSGEAG